MKTERSFSEIVEAALQFDVLRKHRADLRRDRQALLSMLDRRERILAPIDDAGGKEFLEDAFALVNEAASLLR